MAADLLDNAIADVPAGAYAVGVSGGADSVALLHLLHHGRSDDVRVHVVHLDHETRGAESTGDAAFVRELAARWRLPCTVALRSDVERRVATLLQNKSARFRALRHQLFREVIEAEGLRGVILAHHSDDQAETVIHRLLRGTRAPYLAGMAKGARLGGLLILRPLLDVPREALKAYLASVGQPWREDSSNESPAYLRNSLRPVIARHAMLRQATLEVDEAMRALREWVRDAAPRLDHSFPVGTVRGQPEILAADAVRRWLATQGVPSEQIVPDTVARVLEMAIDAASPPRQSLPTGLVICRTRGRIRTWQRAD